MIAIGVSIMTLLYVTYPGTCLDDLDTSHNIARRRLTTSLWTGKAKHFKITTIDKVKRTEHKCLIPLELLRDDSTNQLKISVVLPDPKLPEGKLMVDLKGEIKFPATSRPRLVVRHPEGEKYYFAFADDRGRGRDMLKEIIKNVNENLNNSTASWKPSDKAKEVDDYILKNDEDEVISGVYKGWQLTCNEDVPAWFNFPEGE